MAKTVKLPKQKVRKMMKEMTIEKAGMLSGGPAPKKAQFGEKKPEGGMPAGLIDRGDPIGTRKLHKDGITYEKKAQGVWRPVPKGAGKEAKPEETKPTVQVKTEEKPVETPKTEEVPVKGGFLEQAKAWFKGGPALSKDQIHPDLPNGISRLNHQIDVIKKQLNPEEQQVADMVQYEANKQSNEIQPTEETKTYGDLMMERIIANAEEHKLKGDLPALSEKVAELEAKLTAGTLAGPEIDKLHKYTRWQESLETQIATAIRNQDIRANTEKRQEAQITFEKELDAGTVPFEPIGKVGLESKEIKLSKLDEDEDLALYTKVRFKEMTGRDYTVQQVQEKNKEVVDKFLSINKLTLPNGSKIDYMRGRVHMPFDANLADQITHTLTRNGFTADDYTMVRGKAGDESILSVKQAPKLDWNIVPAPDYTLKDSVAEVNKFYSQSYGGRIQWAMALAPKIYITNNPEKEGGQQVMYLQGKTRGGKGLFYSAMHNQALATATGSIVKFFDFDHTAAFWNNMQRVNPKMYEQMEAKGLIGHSGVSKENIVKMTDPKQQARAIRNYIADIVTSYNIEFGRKSALLAKYKVDNLNDLPVQEYQAVFNIDEMENLETLVNTNEDISKPEKKALMGSLAGIVANNMEVGQKVGILLVPAVQTGFSGEEMLTVNKKIPATLLSLDGNASPRSFGSAEGWTPAIRRGSPGNSVLLRMNQANQIPQPFSVVMPGVGSAKAIGRTF